MIEALDPFDVRLALGAPGLLRAFNTAGLLSPADVHVALRLSDLAGAADPEVALAAALAVRGPRMGHVYVDLATIRHTAAVESEEPVELSALPWPEVSRWVAGLAASGLAAVGEEGGADRPLRLVGTRLYLDRYWREERRLAADLKALADVPGAEVRMDVLADGLARLFGGAGAAGQGRLEPPGVEVAAGGQVRLELRGEGIGDAGQIRLELPGEEIAEGGQARLDGFVGESGRRSGQGADAGQRLAAAAAVLRRFAVIAGGPGTGKTTTVARIAALLFEQAAPDAAAPLIALAAPTGKAAARLEEAVHAEAATLAVDERVRAGLLGLEASTLHRLLGWRPGSHSRFRHHRADKLPHDVVILDETSMVSLSLMARLVEAIRPGARLILVGDPGQLTSVEAGAVLGDIVGPAAGGLRMRAPARERLAAAAGMDVAASEPPAGAAIGDGMVVLERVHRYGAGIATLAAALRRGDADGVLAVLTAPPPGVTWIPADVADAGTAGVLAPVRRRAVAAGATVFDAARRGDARGALTAMGAFRLLCAHRRGAHGVATWTTRLEGWLAADVDGFAVDGPWYAGRPLLVTENDYGLRLYNGDTGVVVAAGPDRVTAAFERRGAIVAISPARLDAVDTVYAMTVHKSQGSQFGTAAVLLPPPASQVLTRELLYTAVTRARKELILVGTEATVRAAVARPAARASGLRERLWGA